MTIELLEPSKVKIVLSKQDLLDLAIDLEHIDGNDRDANAVLLELLSMAAQKTGFSASGSRMLVEVFRGKGNACTIVFTCVPDRPAKALNRQKNRILTPVVYEFPDMETLITTCTRLYSGFCHKIYRSALYRGDSKYHLILYPLDPKTTEAFLSEFGKKVGQGNFCVSYTVEHTTPVIEEDAIETLANYLG